MKIGYPQKGDVQMNPMVEFVTFSETSLITTTALETKGNDVRKHAARNGFEPICQTIS